MALYVLSKYMKLERSKGDMHQTHSFLRAIVLLAWNATHPGRNMVSYKNLGRIFLYVGTAEVYMQQALLLVLLALAFGITTTQPAALVGCPKIYSVAIDHP